MSVLYLVLKFNWWTRNLWWLFQISTAWKMKFSIKDFNSKCDQIRNLLRIWSHLLKKSLMGNVIFLCCEVFDKNTKSWYYRWFIVEYDYDLRTHTFFFFFFLFGFSCTNIHDSQDSRGRGRVSFNSYIQLSPALRTLRHKSGGYCRELTSAHS